MSKQKKQPQHLGMPSHTIDGKRQIIAMAKQSMGETRLTAWVKSKGLLSIKDLHKHVRKKKSGFFRELYENYLSYR
jgi:hypothetical protein